jgi:hypothetical protein
MDVNTAVPSTDADSMTPTLTANAESTMPEPANNTDSMTSETITNNAVESHDAFNTTGNTTNAFLQDSDSDTDTEPVSAHQRTHLQRDKRKILGNDWLFGVTTVSSTSVKVNPKPPPWKPTVIYNDKQGTITTITTHCFQRRTYEASLCEIPLRA